ncbi:MAG: gliding motility-associated C-terminal domain-containing protein, partial [Ginsengibacter sp.]
SCKNSFKKTITVLASPQLIFNPITSICAEKPPIVLNTASETSALPGTGIYSGLGVSGQLFNPSAGLVGTQKITYSYTATNTCKASIDQNITVFPTPQLDAGPDRTLLEGLSLILNATASGNGLKFLWSPTIGISPRDSLNPTVRISDDLTYIITATSLDGCTASDNVFIKVLKEVKVPNAFTPNGDGVNDTWQIKYLDSYPNAEVSIFNRYGQQVYQAIGYSKPWDGTYQGKPLPMGTYYYIINPKNGRAAMNGSVTLIR